MVTLERAGARVYLVGLAFADKDRAKSVLGMTGANWDRERRQWWCGLAKLGAAEALAAELNGRPAPEAKPPGAEQKTDAPAEDVSACRVYAKVRYNGREYYQIAETRDGVRVRLCTLDEAGPVFWAEKLKCELLKTYQPRETGRGRHSRIVHQTVGGLRKFRDEQRKKKAAGAPTCVACGKAGQLVEDLEDGCMKCYGCCDMPGN